MGDNKQAIDAILNGVDYLLETKLANASFDRVYTGIIKRVNSDNTYVVTISGNNYDNVPTIVDGIGINNTVKVMFPQNQASQMFILGKIL